MKSTADMHVWTPTLANYSFAFLPKFVIAVVIIGAVSGLVDVKEIKMLWKISKSDFFLLVLGAIFTMTLGITNGLLASVALSIAIFLKAASHFFFPRRRIIFIIIYIINCSWNVLLLLEDIS